jgi:hypothetical protein
MVLFPRSVFFERSLFPLGLKSGYRKAGFFSSEGE